MENFFYKDIFCSDLEDFINDYFDEFEDLDKQITSLSDDWFVDIMVVEKSEPVFELSVSWIMERINEEMFSEDGEEDEKIAKLLRKHIDFNSINSNMPRVYNPKNGVDDKITKIDLLDYLK